MTNSKVIVLAEPIWFGGHFETQMQLFLSILLPKNCRVIVLCAEPEKVLGWVEKTLPEFRKSIYGAYFNPRAKGGIELLKGRKIWEYLAKTVKESEKNTGWSVDVVAITFVDKFINGLWRTMGLGVRFEYNWVGLYFWPGLYRYRSSLSNRLLRYVNTRLFYRIKNCKAIGILDEGVYSAMKSDIKIGKLFIFPDVTDERLPESVSEAVKNIEIQADGRTIIGLIGLLEKRKGLLSLLRAMSRMDPEKYYFVLAGRLGLKNYSAEEQSEIHSLLNQNSRNLHFEPNFIEDPMEFNSYIDLCDILFLAYEKFYYSSGILTKAAVFKKPVIVSKGYCMAERTDQYGMGVAVAEGNVQEIMDAIALLSDYKTREALLDQAQFKDFRDFHNIGKLEKVLCEMLEVE